MVRAFAALLLGLVLGFTAGRFLPAAEPRVRPRYVGPMASSGAGTGPVVTGPREATAKPELAAFPEAPVTPPLGGNTPGPAPETAAPETRSSAEPAPVTPTAEPGLAAEAPARDTMPQAAEVPLDPQRFARAFPPGRGGRRGQRVPPQVVPRGPGQDSGAGDGESGETETAPEPFNIPEAQLRAIRDLRSRYQAVTEEKLAPIRENIQALREQASAAQEEAQRAMEEELRAGMSPEEFSRYKAEEENGRLDEAMQALELMDRGFLGIYFDPQRIDETAVGVRITEVQKGSAADYAGVRAGEVIVGLNGNPIADWRAFRTGVRDTPPGSPLVLRLYDPETQHTREVTVVLGDAGREALRRLYEGEE